MYEAPPLPGKGVESLVKSLEISLKSLKSLKSHTPNFRVADPSLYCYITNIYTGKKTQVQGEGLGMRLPCCILVWPDLGSQNVCFVVGSVTTYIFVTHLHGNHFFNA